MNIYSAYGLTEFFIALGYKGEMINQYFLDFYAINNDITIDLSNGAKMIRSNGKQFNWKVHLTDTGLYTQTGGRLKQLQKCLEGEETFMFTYGDGCGRY